MPRHRIGPVLHALLLLGRRAGPAELARRLTELVHAVDVLGAPGPDEERPGFPEAPSAPAEGWGTAPPADGTTAA
ncbi:hypothetical protein ADK38_47905, partial [Streptomyces varsoviensis]